LKGRSFSCAEELSPIVIPSGLEPARDLLFVADNSRSLVGLKASS